MVNKFGVDPETAGIIPSLLPLGTMVLTPFFGNLYDRKGKGATIMIIGAVLLIFVHAMFSVPIPEQPVSGCYADNYPRDRLLPGAFSNVAFSAQDNTYEAAGNGVCSYILGAELGPYGCPDAYRLGS
jgi:nitrate/nitrite transporter NarK